MNPNFQPDNSPQLPLDDQRGSALLTQVEAADRPFLQGDLADRLLQELAELPTEPVLLFFGTDGIGTSVVPIGTEVTVGRLASKSDVAVSSPHLSNPHFRITRRRNAFALTDLRSRNGTLLNGRRWDDPRFVERGLERGDCIQAGGVSFIFW